MLYLGVGVLALAAVWVEFWLLGWLVNRRSIVTFYDVEIIARPMPEDEVVLL